MTILNKPNFGNSNFFKAKKHTQTLPKNVVFEFKWPTADALRKQIILIFIIQGGDGRVSRRLEDVICDPSGIRYICGHFLIEYYFTVG